MSTDAKGHTSIAAGENPTRAALAAAILSINDPIYVANATAAATLLSNLAGLSPAIVPSSSTPIFIFQGDIATYLVNVGSGWQVTGALPVTGSGSLAANTTETAVTGCTLASLPAGTWRIDAKGTCDWSVTGAGPAYVLRIRQGTTAGAELDRSEHTNAALVAKTPFALIVPTLTLASATDILLTAIVTGPASGTTAVSSAKIVATRIR